MTYSREYTSWVAAKRRCRDPKRAQWKDYGGRGITFSPAFERFEDFLAYMGQRPEGTDLDRIDVNGNYEPGNVRWWPKGKGERRNSRQ
jgi:hypothetical protein